MAGGSWFNKLQPAPPDTILGVVIACKADTHPQKVDLGIGAYRCNLGKPYIFPVVLDAEKLLMDDKNMNKEYLPIDGLPGLKKPTQGLIFGAHSKAVTENRICTSQCLSGTGGLRIIAEFLSTYVSVTKVAYISQPTWTNHIPIFQKADFKVAEYPYWDPATKRLDFNAMIETLKHAPDKSVIILHACAHNPTGVDPTPDQWKQIIEVVKSKGHFPLLDCAYLGYATGSLENDATAIRMFEQSGLQMAVVQSFAKNLGLYSERIGMAHLVCNSTEEAETVMSLLKLIIRPMYSNPPSHGGRIVEKILTDPKLYTQWVGELTTVAERVKSVRSKLQKHLENKNTPGIWSHIVDQIGMFSYTGLSREQSERMTSKHHIYMLKNGRISLAGLNDDNITYVADCIDECVRAIP